MRTAKKRAARADIAARPVCGWVDVLLVRNVPAWHSELSPADLDRARRVGDSLDD